MTLTDNPSGNYRFLTGIAPYSCGVVAMPEYEVVRVKLHRPVPLRAGVFEKIAAHITTAGRPLQALCSMELRIPEALTFDGFKAFNDAYQLQLMERGLLLGEVNPIARTNIASAEIKVQEPSVYAFSYTIPSTDTSKLPSFIVAGAGDLIDQTDLSVSAILRPNETSIPALKEKIAAVMKVMQERLLGLETDWNAVSCINVYTEIPLHTVLVNSVLRPAGVAGLNGITWHYSNPPIKGLIYEMDVRGVQKEQVVAL